MNMVDFGALPPEINSGRMYAGAGSGPLAAAAAAWEGLASQLGSAATSYRAVVSDLTSGAWVGPSSLSMAAAATEVGAVWAKAAPEPKGAWGTRSASGASASRRLASQTVRAKSGGERRLTGREVISRCIGKAGSCDPLIDESWRRLRDGGSGVRPRGKAAGTACNLAQNLVHNMFGHLSGHSSGLLAPRVECRHRDHPDQ